MTEFTSTVATKVLLPGLLSVCACALIPAAWAAPIPGLYDTGVLNDGALAAAGSVDLHYALVSSADPNFPGQNAYVASPIDALWLQNTATSQWIAPNAGNATVAHPGGYYTYRLQFDLTGLNPATASISGTWATDDTGTIYLNGINTGNLSQGFSSATPFSIGSGFVAGINTLDFNVFNQTVFPSPTGLQVDSISGTAQVVPVPAGVWLFGSGLAGLIGVARKRNHAVKGHGRSRAV